MSVRDPGFDPRRRRRPRDGAHRLTPETGRPAWLLPAVLGGTLLLPVLAIGAGVFAFGTGSPAASPSVVAEVPSASSPAVESPSEAASPSAPDASTEPSPSAEPSGSPEPGPLVDGEVAIA